MINRLSKAVGAMLLIAAFTAVPAYASTAAFSYSGAVPTRIVGSAQTSQTFESALETLTCEDESLSGTWDANYTERLPALSATYSHCSMWGSPATVSSTTFQFWANEGRVGIEHEISIRVAELCTITIPAQSASSSVTYEDLNGVLLAKVHYSNISWSGCFDSGEHGTYTGTVELWGESGGYLGWSGS